MAKIAENWPAKALSIALAIILFVFHRMNTLSTRPVSIPLTVQTGAELVPANPSPRTVRVILRGEEDSITSIAEGDITAFIDLNRYKTKGWHRAPVQIQKAGSALGIEPLEITVNPMEISVLLDWNGSKTVPLAVDIRGRAPSGFDLADYSISPKEIAVTGPLGVLENITEFKTESVDLQGRSGDFTVTVNIINTNPLVIMRGDRTVEFNGVIRPSVQVRTIEGLPVVLTGLNPKFRAEGDGRTGTVRLEGNQNRLDFFRPPDGFLSIDCSGLTDPGTYTLPVTVNLPDGLKLIRQDPEELRLTVTLISAEPAGNPSGNPLEKPPERPTEEPSGSPPGNQPERPMAD
jgi:YbbR domain-containing protein